jgi:hypothetical protein
VLLVRQRPSDSRHRLGAKLACGALCENKMVGIEQVSAGDGWLVAGIRHMDSLEIRLSSSCCPPSVGRVMVCRGWS